MVFVVAPVLVSAVAMLTEVKRGIAAKATMDAAVVFIIVFQLRNFKRENVHNRISSFGFDVVLLGGRIFSLPAGCEARRSTGETKAFVIEASVFRQAERGELDDQN